LLTSGTWRCRAGRAACASTASVALVSSLGWPDDVVEQFLYDHADNIGFLRDYGDLDLSKIEWDVEIISVEELTEMPTSASDGDCIEDFAANPDHWVRVRNRGIHIGVAQCWETHGTWVSNGKKRVTSPKRAWSRWSDGEVADDAVVALLGVGQGEAGVEVGPEYGRKGP
jgi:hypothetical protein